jgi:hypothetical protein
MEWLNRNVARQELLQGKSASKQATADFTAGGHAADES